MTTSSAWLTFLNMKTWFINCWVRDYNISYPCFKNCTIGLTSHVLWLRWFSKILIYDKNILPIRYENNLDKAIAANINLAVLHICHPNITESSSSQRQVLQHLTENTQCPRDTMEALKIRIVTRHCSPYPYQSVCMIVWVGYKTLNQTLLHLCVLSAAIPGDEWLQWPHPPRPVFVVWLPVSW